MGAGAGPKKASLIVEFVCFSSASTSLRAALGFNCARIAGLASARLLTECDCT